MFTQNELIDSLELEIAQLKAAPMLSKPKFAESCISIALTVIKSQNEQQRETTEELTKVKTMLAEHQKRGH